MRRPGGSGVNVMKPLSKRSVTSAVNVIPRKKITTNIEGDIIESKENTNDSVEKLKEDVP